jgi:hypothetical protein
MFDITWNVKSAFSNPELFAPFYKFKFLLPPSIEVNNLDINIKDDKNNIIKNNKEWEELKELGFVETNCRPTALLKDLADLTTDQHNSSNLNNEELLKKQRSVEKFIYKHGLLGNHENGLCVTSDIKTYIDFANNFYYDFLISMVKIFKKSKEQRKKDLLIKTIYEKLDTSVAENIINDDNKCLQSEIDLGRGVLLEYRYDCILNMICKANCKTAVYVILLNICLNNNQIDICDSCHSIYFRKRLPKKGMYSYCYECRENYKFSKKMSEQNNKLN